MKKDKICMFVPPAIDWSMPLIALPLLKSYISKEITCKIIDVNVDFFNRIWDEQHINVSKNAIIEGIKKGSMIEAVSSSIKLEKKILLKRLNDSEYILSRKVHSLNEWYDSDKVYKFLNCESETERILKDLLLDYDLEDNKVFAISISVEDQIVPSFLLMKILKEKYTSTPIVLGGNIISRLAKKFEISKLSKYFDVLIVGEGEEVLPNVINDLLKNILPKEKIVYGKNNEDDNEIWKLNTPIFEDIVWGKYLCPLKIMPITLNRKCDWARCDFCAIHSCWNGGHRERDIDDIVEEIVYYVRTFQVNYFRIVDENVSPNILDRFSKKIMDKGIKIYYEMYTRFDKAFLDIDFVKQIYQSGCRQIFWGIENIDDGALKMMRKGTNSQIIDDTLRNTADVGILNYCFILMGIPNIPISSEEKTIQYVISNKNIHVAAIGSYVVDRLSPMEKDFNVQEKYGISLHNVGDITTEIGYTLKGYDASKEIKERTIRYIERIYKTRPDYALSSLLNEEIRFVLTAKFSNNFIYKYISGLSRKEMDGIVEEAINRSVEERVLRNCEV